MTTPALRRLELAAIALPDVNRRSLARAYHEHAETHDETCIRHVWKAFVAVIDAVAVRATVADRAVAIVDPWVDQFDETQMASSTALQRLQLALMAMPDANRRALARAYHEHAAQHRETLMRHLWAAFVAVIDEAAVRATIADRNVAMILDPWSSSDFDEVR